MSRMTTDHICSKLVPATDGQSTTPDVGESILRLQACRIAGGVRGGGM